MELGNSPFGLGDLLAQGPELVTGEDLAAPDCFEPLENPFGIFDDAQTQRRPDRHRLRRDSLDLGSTRADRRVDPAVAAFEEIVHRVEELEAIVLGEADPDARVGIVTRFLQGEDGIVQCEWSSLAAERGDLFHPLVAEKGPELRVVVLAELHPTVKKRSVAVRRYSGIASEIGRWTS
jgi:hypothetical protein